MPRSRIEAVRSGRWLAAATVLIVAAVGVAVAVDGSSSSSPTQVPPPASEAPASGATASADWLHRPDSLRELVGKPPAFGRPPTAVVATAVDIDQGEPLRPQEPDALPDQQPIATQTITFEVEDRWFGQIPDRFTLFKTGSDEEFADGDPPYRVGEDYVLFVRPREGETQPGNGEYVLVAPDGRLRIEDGRVYPVIDGPVGERLRGAEVAEARRASQEERRNANAGG